jgi:hypothetical protein
VVRRSGSAASAQRFLDEVTRVRHLFRPGRNRRDRAAGAGTCGRGSRPGARRRVKGKKPPAGRPKTLKGRYVNPANPEQAYELGRGRPPRWFSELEASGQLPDPENTTPE